MRLIAPVEQAQLAGVGRRARLRQLEDRAPTAAIVFRGRSPRVSPRIGVAGLVEVELLEVRAGTELAVLGRLNGVASAILGALLASNGALPFFVSWIVTHWVLNTLP